MVDFIFSASSNPLNITSLPFLHFILKSVISNKLDKFVAKMAFRADGDIDLTPELDYNAMDELIQAVKNVLNNGE